MLNSDIANKINSDMKDNNRLSTLVKEMKKYPSPLTIESDEYSMVDELTTYISRIVYKLDFHKAISSLLLSNSISTSLAKALPASIQPILDDFVFSAEPSQLNFDRVMCVLQSNITSSMMVGNINVTEDTIVTPSVKRVNYLKDVADLSSRHLYKIGSWAMLDTESELGDLIDQEAENPNNYIGRLAKLMDNDVKNVETFMSSLVDGKLSSGYVLRITEIISIAKELSSVTATDDTSDLSSDEQRLVHILSSCTALKEKLENIHTLEKDIDKLMKRLAKDFNVK